MSRAWPVAHLDPSGTLDDNARRILAVRLAEFYSYAPIIGDESAVEELHNLRIAAKRLRYTLELFRSVFGEIGDRQIERVKAIQEELGLIHDHDVRIDLIEEELRALATEQLDDLHRSLAAAPADEHRAIATAAMRPPPDDPRRGLIALLGRQHAARRDHFRRFLAHWQEFGTAGMRQELVALSAYPMVRDSATPDVTPPSTPARRPAPSAPAPARADIALPSRAASGKKRARSA
jgi:hypothetical protein